jgi:hypothetical protein
LELAALITDTSSSLGKLEFFKEEALIEEEKLEVEIGGISKTFADGLINSACFFAILKAVSLSIGSIIS